MAVDILDVKAAEVHKIIDASEHLTVGHEDRVTIINLMPVKEMLPHYQGSGCTGWLENALVPQNEGEMIATVRKYTSNAFYKKLNLGLAMDMRDVIADFDAYIQQLRYCIQELPGYAGANRLTRGAQLSKEEVAQMKELKRFHMPGFTSTTVKQTVDASFNYNTVIRIDASEGRRVTLDIANSPHKDLLTPYPNEQEVLIQCYSLFEFEREEHTMGKREIFLKLVDPMNEHGEMLALYHKAKAGKWKEVLAELDGKVHKARVCARYIKPTSGWTMLHQAAWWGNQQAADKLMELGADPTVVAKYPAGKPTPAQVKHKHGTAVTFP